MQFVLAFVHFAFFLQEQKEGIFES
jgi:hypothetical protein